MTKDEGEAFGFFFWLGFLLLLGGIALRFGFGIAMIVGGVFVFFCLFMAMREDKHKRRNQ